MIYYSNGQFVDKEKEDVHVSIDDRGYYFGDGVYEVIKIYDGKLFTAKEHITRLFRSATEIKMTIPYTEQQLIEIAEQLAKQNEIEVGHIYLQITRGIAPRTHHFPTVLSPVLTAYAIHNPRPEQQINDGVHVKSVEDIRWMRCDIKSLNLLGNVLAKQEAFESGCHEAMLVRNGVVTEGSSSNIFGVKNGKLYTHPATEMILNGITRQVVLSLCHELNFSVTEKAFSYEEALEMDEIFLTSTTSEVMPIVQLDGQLIDNGNPGPITKALQRAFVEKALPTAVH